MVLVGRLVFGGEIKTVVYHEGRYYSVSDLIAKSESEIDRDFYYILRNAHDFLSSPDEKTVIHDRPEGYSVPVPEVTSLRDFFAFEEHVSNARKARGEKIPDEWYKFPVFYYSNRKNIIANLEPLIYPKYTNMLDYEMELAFVVGKRGKNISADDYEEYIVGVTIANDWSARDIQREETRVGLGPAKGKDFGTSLGPFILSIDSLAGNKISRGIYNIQLSGIVNGKKYGSSNMSKIHFDLGMIIERASDETTVYPGDVIMTGTFGNGTILEMQGTGKDWLKRGDTVTISSDIIGELTNKVI